jgi:hypothetical protein
VLALAEGRRREATRAEIVDKAADNVIESVRLRAREVGESRIRIVNLSANKFFGF